MRELKNTNGAGDGTPRGVPSIEELMEAVDRAERGVITRILARSGMTRMIADVAQDTRLAVWSSRESYSPAKGSVQSWVNVIAKNHSINLIRKELTQVEGRTVARHGSLFHESGEAGLSAEEQLETAAQAEAHLPHRETGQSRDVAEDLAESMSFQSWLRPIMVGVASVLEPAVFIHAAQTYAKFNRQVPEAAAEFGMDEARLREHLRQFELHAQVIGRAQALARELEQARRVVGSATVAELLSCLPDYEVSGGRLRRMGDVLAAWPGKLTDVPVEWLQAKTGWSYNTARQYRAESVKFLNLAWGVLTLPKGDQ